jgi:hypothetical protein
MLAAHPPVHHVQRASAGNVRAVLAWDQSTGSYGTTFSHIRLSVRAGGKLLVSRTIGGHVQVHGRAVRVVKLSPDAGPTVLVDVYTGGAHCCTVTRLFLADGRELQRNWGDPGYTLVDLDGDGTLELRSADDAFAYEFTDYADSALPVEIWNLRGGRLVDTTGDHLGAVAADARRLRSYERQFHRQGRDPRGVLGAYVADEALLGTPDVGWSLVDQALADGDLDHGIEPPPVGATYVAYLRRFLTKTGYLTRR